jgi:hypothetical protein
LFIGSDGIENFNRRKYKIKTMKIILIVIFATLSLVSTYGQSTSKNVLKGTIEEENTVRDGEITPQVKVSLSYGGKTKTGGYCWFQISKSYSQTYCGGTYQPKNWIQVGLAGGVETGAKTLKGAGFVWVGKGRFSNLLVIEKGGTGTWYRNQTDVKVGKSLAVSLASQKGQGTGVRAEFAIPKTRVAAGGEYLFSTRTAKFGLTYSF